MGCIFLSFGQQPTGEKSILSYHNQAIKQMHKNELDAALNTLNIASRIAEENDDLKGLLKTYLLFAKVSLELDDADASVFYKDRSAITLRGMEYNYGQAYLNYIEARLQLLENNPFQALALIEGAKELSNDKNLRNNIQLLEANIFRYRDRFDEAEKNYNALLINSDELEQSYLAAKANVGLARLNEKQEDLEKSALYLESALSIAEKNGFSKIAHQSYENLTRIYEDLALYDQALKNQRKLTKIRDSVFTIEQLKIISKTADDVTKAQKMQRLQSLEKQIKNLQNLKIVLR